MEILKEIWSTARHNKLRTCLTGFAVAWGIFMIVFLLGAGNGLINANQLQMQRFLASSVEVSGRWTSKAFRGYKEGRKITLNENDIAITSNTFPDYVEDVGGRVSQEGVTVTYGEKYLTTQNLLGVSPNEAEINKRVIKKGRFINQRDLNEKRKTAVLSEQQAKELAGNAGRLLGKHINIDNIAYVVVGVTQDEEMEQNNNIFTPYTTLKTLYNKGDEAENILFKIRHLDTEEANVRFEEVYRARINIAHNAAPDDPYSIGIWNRKAENLQMDTGMDIIRKALWIVGLFTLLSGIVGVSNIMLITVKERTHEFGIRKAIGAKPWHILRMIIIESIIITTFFGYIGVVCGLAANEYMDATAGQMVIDTGLFKMRTFVNPTVGLDVCLQTLIVMIVAGTLAGIMPAWRAARIRPIEALRYE